MDKFEIRGGPKLRVRHIFLMTLATVSIVLAGPVLCMDIKYVHTDAQGNIVAISDANRTIIERYEYEPYGLPITNVPDGPGYTGHMHDGDSDLIYMQQRYYDPQIGRFLSVDPVLPSAVNGSNFNRYWYANNNPYTYTDPDGRWPSQLGFYVHQDSIERVIGPHVSERELEILKHSQVIADGKEYQTGETSFRHAMRSAGQTDAEARAMTEAFIRTQFEKAWNAPTWKEALTEFGIALHALQDGTSPSHSGFQEWTGEESREEVWKHITNELFDPGADSELDAVTQAAWDVFIEGRRERVNESDDKLEGVPTYRVNGRLDSRRLKKREEKQ